MELAEATVDLLDLQIAPKVYGDVCGSLQISCGRHGSRTRTRYQDHFAIGSGRNTLT